MPNVLLTSFLSRNVCLLLLNALEQNTDGRTQFSHSTSYKNKSRFVTCRSQWLTIGKRTFFFQMHKRFKRTPSFRFRGTSEKALAITPVIPAHPFELPPSGNTVIDFVNELGYSEPVEIVSNIRVNYVYQPWRAFLSLINQCLTGKTSGSDKPRHLVLQILWGIVTQTNVDHAELLWEEFTQGIQTFFSYKASHKASLKNPKKKVTPLLIPYRRFSKVIIYYLASNNNIHRRPDSAVHHTGDDYVLGNLKFVPKESETETTAPKDDKDQDVTSSKPSLLVTPPPINTEATTITTSLPEITPFIALQLRVARLEQEMSEVKKTVHSADVVTSIRSHVPTAVDKYLGTKLDDALLKVLERHTADLIEKYTVLPGPESIQNQESEKSPKEIIRIKREQGEEKQDSTYSIKSTDKVDLEEFDLKSALFRHMNKNKSANRNTTNYHLYHALMEALIADEDAMDKEVKDTVKDHKRKHDSDDDEDDDDDEGPSAGSNQGRSTKRRRSDSAASGSAHPPPKDDDQSSKKPRESDASASKQHPALTSTGWKITDSRECWCMTLFRCTDRIPKTNILNDLRDTHESGLKPIPESERPSTPEPKWTIPPNDFPEPENNWANTYATTYKVPEENKLQRKTLSTLLKPFKEHRLLHIRWDECHKLLTNKVDLSIPEGHQIPQNIYDPLPLGGPPGQVTIQPQFFFNKDLDYLLIGDKERKIDLSISKLKAARYLDFSLEELVPSLWVESEREYTFSA
ncbi:hypothetical protein Tco_1092227 [Tanacetum coccineum]|uniref:Monodehydroascorbate reductase n=1 Tax=Tanacetum coccineum TaxID=301880 RepID=A0ABQ5IAI3_9ASTR